MSYLQYVARRALAAIASVYGAVTAAFLLANYLWKYRLKQLWGFASLDGGLSAAEKAQIRREFVQERNLDAPLYVRYVDWLVDVTTLDFGHSYAYDEPVLQVLVDPTVTTLEYVVAGVVLAMVISVPLGVLTALAKDSTLDRSVRFTVYSLLALPAFVTVDYLEYILTNTSNEALALSLVQDHPRLLAVGLVAISLLAGQIRFGRSAALEELGRDYVKLLRSKGMSRRGVARHVLRNAALPVVSMSGEIVPVLALDVFVIEEVLPIQGLSSVILAAIHNGAVAIIIWSAMVFVAIAIGGYFLIDVLYGYLDPRIRAGE